MDFTIYSAEDVLAYLEGQGARFPLIASINDTVGIDEQPGYRQIVALDSEGNLVSFSEYSEY